MIVPHAPELSVVIVNYHSENELFHCLRSIESQDVPVEVIVVDNGSDPWNRVRVFSTYPGVVWHDASGNIGFGAASNIGAVRSSSGNLFFLNPDTLMLPGAASQLVRALDSAEGRRAILGCAIYNDDGSLQLSCRRFPNWRTFVASRFSLLTRLFPENQWSARYLMRDFSHDKTQCVDWVSGAAMAMTLEVWETLGGFDRSFFVHFEDVDFCRRAAGMGIQTFYFPEARIVHQIGASSSVAPIRALVYRHRSMWTYYRRYHGRLWRDPFAAVLIGARLGALMAGNAIARITAQLRQPTLGARRGTD